MLKNLPSHDIGPWPDGLNEVMSPWDIKDTELQECLNFDVHDDGLLRPRRNFTLATDTNNYLDPTGAISGNQPLTVNLLGAFELSNLSRIVYAHSVITGAGKFLYTADPAAGWTEVTTAPPTGDAYASMVVYNGQVYVVPTTWSGNGLTTNGIKFPVASLGATNPVFTLMTLPRGDQAFMIKDRLFVISWDESKVFYSKATDPATWAAPDGGTFLVSPNDGGSITGVVLFRDVLYIFKDGSIWQFTFSTDPGLDGVLQKITDEFGGVATSDDTDIYFANSKGCYALVNSQPILLSQKLDWNKLALTNNIQLRTKDYGIIAIPGRLIIRRSGGEEGFSYNTRTGAWSRYTWGRVGSASQNYMKGGRYTEFTRNTFGKVMWLSCNWFDNRMWYFRDDYLGIYDGSPTKQIFQIRTRMQTKFLTLGERIQYKRFYRAWMDGWINYTDGNMMRVQFSLNNGVSHDAPRATVGEPLAGLVGTPVSDRWVKIVNLRFLSLSIILDLVDQDTFVVSGKTFAANRNDTLSLSQKNYYLRRFVAYISAKREQPV